MTWDADPYPDMVPVPRATCFPIEVTPPAGFRPDDPSTWPKLPGRFEFVAGRLVYMTPCGRIQGSVVVSIAGLLDRWLDGHPEFLVETNEAGMLLSGEVRAADAAVWGRRDVGPPDVGYARVPPILAVEVAGDDEHEPALRAKAAWYLHQGVAVVWLVLPETREVVVLRPAGEVRHGAGATLELAPELPDLAPEVDRFFRQLV